MSTPDDESDPTGMRALLRGLPDPGPMPDDLVERIHSSLADLGAPDHLRSEGRHPREAVSRGTAQGRSSGRPSWWVRTGPKAAVAAAVLIGGGALLSGPLGLVGSGNDSATTSADSSTAGRSEDLSQGGSEADPQSGGDAGGAARDLPEPGSVVVTMSGRSYTAAGLASEVASAGPGTSLAPLTAESPGIGPIGTELGVRSCLEALGLAPDTAARVDLAPVDGTPAAVVVVTRDGERTAYAVGRDCTLGNPAVIAGPVDLS